MSQKINKIPIVSIVGRPNVGKSCLFNRILGKRLAVVHDIPGVTRDRNYKETQWNGVSFKLTDTGGLIPNAKDSIAKDIAFQVETACKEASVILFVVDATTGITNEDIAIAKILKKSVFNKVILVINKSESKEANYNINDFISLGFKKQYPISAIHGTGVGDLLDLVVSHLKKTKDLYINNNFSMQSKEIKIAIVGRPNAGKSSIVNKLLGKQRMIVRPEPGTTRDSIDSEINYKDYKIILIDTAGLRKKSNVKDDVEYFCNLRAIESIKRCNISALIVDISIGLHEQDLRIARKIYEERKGLILCLNKWDLINKNFSTFDQISRQIKISYRELSYIPILAVSALTGKRINSILDKTIEIYNKMNYKVNPEELSQLVLNWTTTNPHPIVENKTISIIDCYQKEASFPLFHVISTNYKKVLPSYKRFLENKLHEKYDFSGCPLIVEFVSGSQHKKLNYFK